ncbi:MAG: 3-phosphoshikimate 1-carboxyvinyltransferase [Ruthenibacterium sp.]
MQVTLFPSQINGTVFAPPSKSMAHRALLAAGLAAGVSRVAPLAFSQDMTATINALRQLGATAVCDANSATITGKSLPFLPVAAPVDCCESGSTLRFILPVFSLTNAPVAFCGQGRLLARPQQIYADLFAARGLTFTQTDSEIRIDGALTAGRYTIDGSVSSQFISGLLFALSLLEKPSEIHIKPPFESRSYVNCTVQTLADFKVDVVWKDAHTLYLPGNQHYHAHDAVVEGDYSQAAFFAVLGAVCGGVTLCGLRADSVQGDRVILDILKRCGAVFETNADAITFQKSVLHATEINLADCPDLGPVLMVLALFCEGETVLVNAGRLRIKESDRIAAMESEIHKMGGAMHTSGDTITIRKSTLHGAENLISHNDHRIAMAMSVAALCANVPVSIQDAQAVRKSYPDFFAVLQTLGANVEVHKIDAET